MEEKSTNAFRFEDLRVYGKSLDYIRWLLPELNNCDDNHLAHVRNKFIDEAINISMLLVGGSAKGHAVFVQYLKDTKTSIRNCAVYTDILYQQHALNDAQREQSRGFLVELSRMTGALLVSMQRSMRVKGSQQLQKDYDAENDYLSDMSSADFTPIY